MPEASRVCSDCQKKMAESKTNDGGAATITKEDRWKLVQATLKKAEGCEYFCHHGIYDADGKIDPLQGKRTCSLAIRRSCGHTEPKYGLCDEWFEGKVCVDLKEKVKSS
jgi:hypothetical protein